MIKPVVHDPIFLAQPSADATKEDLPIAQDLLDTLKANAHQCVGMAANMIGCLKNIIVVADGKRYLTMINPKILRKSGEFATEEGCLSLPGIRPCTRYKSIQVEYLDEKFRKKNGRFSGWTAQIIQHEMDHCQGILI